MSEAPLLMPQRAVENDGSYVAWVNEYDQYHNITGGFWTKPTRVYRGGKGRQSIEFRKLDGQALQIRENHPGAGSFRLYKVVE